VDLWLRESIQARAEEQRGRDIVAGVQKLG
jgi:hypothetical protein